MPNFEGLGLDELVSGSKSACGWQRLRNPNSCLGKPSAEPLFELALQWHAVFVHMEDAAMRRTSNAVQFKAHTIFVLDYRKRNRYKANSLSGTDADVKNVVSIFEQHPLCIH